MGDLTEAMLILLIYGVERPEFGKTCLYNTCTLPQCLKCVYFVKSVFPNDKIWIRLMILVVPLVANYDIVAISHLF